MNYPFSYQVKYFKNVLCLPCKRLIDFQVQYTMESILVTFTLLNIYIHIVNFHPKLRIGNLSCAAAFYSSTSCFPAGIYRLKGNNTNTRARCEICSKLTIKTRHHWRRSGVFIVNFKHVSHLVLVFLLLTLNMLLPARFRFCSVDILRPANSVLKHLSTADPGYFEIMTKKIHLKQL